MGSVAQSIIREAWKDIHFSKVNHVVAKENHIERVMVYRVVPVMQGLMLRDSLDYCVSSLSEVRKDDLWRSEVVWNHYYGFTADGIYFQQKDCQVISVDLDFGFDVILGYPGHKKPSANSFIAGKVIDSSKGRRFESWFHCPPGLNFFNEILGGTNLSEEDLAFPLLTTKYPDMFWAIARLVLFDNIEPFVAQLKPRSEWPQHPAFGREYPVEDYYGSSLPVIHWEGMYLPVEVTHFVHEISYALEADWWQEFQYLADREGLEYVHPKKGKCRACEIERIKRGG